MAAERAFPRLALAKRVEEDGADARLRDHLERIGVETHDVGKGPVFVHCGVERENQVSVRVSTMAAIRNIVHD